MSKYLVVGAGLSGSTFARCMHEAGHYVDVIDQRPHIGGNVFDEVNGDTYRHLYGPHLFHTNSRKVVDFLSQFTAWIAHTHKVKADVHGQLVDMPVNLRTIEQLYPPHLAKQLQEDLVKCFGFNTKVSLQKLTDSPVLSVNKFAKFVIDNFISNYSAKAWGTDVFALDPEILKRIPVRINYDDRYFEDTFQAQPAQGFAPMVNSMLKGINVSLNTSFTKDMANEFYDRIYYTGTIDALMDYKLGPSPYRGLDFEWFIRDARSQKPTVVNHPHDMRMTRTTNFGDVNPKTGESWFCSEIPRAYDHTDSKDIPYYPVRSDNSRALYHQYLELASVNPKFIFAGRLGRFEYLNMDQAVAQALSIASKELE